jgi:uncharacterized coiled-coil protein SlyX
MISKKTALIIQKRQKVASVLDDYQQKLVERADLENLVLRLNVQLGTIKSSRISDMPSAHDPLASTRSMIKAIDQRAELLSMIDELNKTITDVEFALDNLSEQNRFLIDSFYLSGTKRLVAEKLTKKLNTCIRNVYRYRDYAVNELYRLLFPEEAEDIEEATELGKSREASYTEKVPDQNK